MNTKNLFCQKQYFIRICQLTRGKDIAFDVRYQNSVEFIDINVQTIFENK